MKHPVFYLILIIIKNECFAEKLKILIARMNLYNNTIKYNTLKIRDKRDRIKGNYSLNWIENNLQNNVSKIAI